VMYNPEQRRVEWTNVPMRPVDILPGTDLQVYRSPPMYLFIEQPGEFYQQVSLDGQVEVEIPGTLLSGLNVHMYNGAGRTQKNLQPNLTTSVINDLVFVLDEAFAQRPLALYQRLHFDEVIPDDLRIADIRATLTDRGFQIVRDSLLHRSYDVLHHFLWGECPEGSNTLRLWLFIMGRRYPAERQARMRGGMMFTRAIEGGEIEIYMRGELVGNSQRLTQQMNMVQVALRDRFAHLRAKR
jgi:hypothetical protein